MTSEPGQQTITIHILPNISRSKGNQTMKFGQLIKYNQIDFGQIHEVRSFEDTEQSLFHAKLFKCR